MKILKLKGKNQELVLEQIKKEYGDQAVVLNIQQEKNNTIFKWFKASKTVVTIALKDEQEETFKASDDWQTKEQMETQTYQVLLALKEQIETMQHTITDLSKGREVQEVLQDNSSSQKMLDILKGKLLTQGINQEIVEIILNGINEKDEVEDVVRILYSNIEKFLQKEFNVKDLPQIVFFIGPTGVGKTTTIAKLTAEYVINQGKKVVLFTSDTYRIAAIDQLRTYADILGVEIEIIYEANELLEYIEKWNGVDHIFIDTAGRSHKNMEQIEDIKELLQTIQEKQVFLVLNANTSCKDLKNIIATYEEVYPEFELIITKLDETDEIGNVVNIAYYANKPILYLTHGQNVPADIKGFNADEYTSYLLGRINYE